MMFYISNKNNHDLIKVIITYKKNIIYYNLLNLNSYSIKFNIDNEYVKIYGNKLFVIVNNNIYRLYKIYNHSSIIYKSKLINIYVSPIHTYSKEDCCICYNNQVNIVGLCGHQNVCNKCMEYINKCPMCNNTFIFDKIQY